MDNETYESEYIGGSSNSYQGNPIMFIVHTRHGFMFGARGEIVLNRSCRAHSKSQRAQIASVNEEIVASIVADFEKAFAANTDLVFSGQSYRCDDIVKVEISDGNSVGNNGVLATVSNPHISLIEGVMPMAE